MTEVWGFLRSPGIVGNDTHIVCLMNEAASDSAAHEARQDVIAVRCCFDSLRTQSAV